MPTITPFLWFNDEAEEAAKFYTSIFPRSKIAAVAHYGPSGYGKPGTVMTVDFTLDGTRVTALNGGPMFKFSDAFSFVVACKSQKEIDHYWNKLSSRGGKKGPCGWLKDRFGFSWQVVPTKLGDWIAKGDPVRADRVMKEILKMSKLDFAALERAARGPSKPAGKRARR